MEVVGIFCSHLFYFTALGIFCCHLCSIFYGYLVYFVVIWHIFPRCPNENLATLLPDFADIGGGKTSELADAG
jgi:hypothetical protein